ncbi:MAG: formylglycine-generating enzyme family protein [Cyanobacteria bacterium P01_F01_bin.150]
MHEQDDIVRGDRTQTPRHSAVLDGEDRVNEIYKNHKQLPKPLYPGQILHLEGFPLIKAVEVNPGHLVFCYVEPLPLDDDTVPLSMVWIPGGSFMMGSPNSEIDRAPWEGPQYRVTVPGFWMGRYPITQAQWRMVARYPKRNQSLLVEPSLFNGDDLPVESVSWYESMEFCDRLFQQTNRRYQLPSEAEWEYACRAGTTTRFHFGNCITNDLANYLGTAYRGRIQYCGIIKTAPVNHFGVSNAFGLCDMHGNVWEWCLDCWHDYEGAPTDGSARLGNLTPSGFNRRILVAGLGPTIPGSVGLPIASPTPLSEMTTISVFGWSSPPVRLYRLAGVRLTFAFVPSASSPILK